MERSPYQNRKSGFSARKSISAFTLMELIVVLTILAIIVAIVVPMVADTSGNMQAVAGARMVATDLQYAQNIAITEQRPITVTFDTTTNSYSLSNASSTLIHPIYKTAYSIQFGAGSDFDQLSIVSASFGVSSAVTFDELGAPSNSGTVTLRSGTSVYTIDVAAATGVVTVAGS